MWAKQTDNPAECVSALSKDNNRWVEEKKCTQVTFPLDAQNKKNGMSAKILFTFAKLAATCV